MLDRDTMRSIVRVLNRNKKNLKNCEYEFDGITYFIVGIGPEAIKAIKGSDESAKYFRYSQLEGQYLANKLLSCIQQSVLC